jgi:hypothetical protein
MKAHPEHTTAIDTLAAVETAEILALIVEMCDLFDLPLAEPLRRVTGGGYALIWLRQDLVRLAKAMHTGIEL